MNNRYNLDTDYFSRKLKLVLEGIHNYTPEEMARELVRMAVTASEAASVEEFVWQAGKSR